jgi:hypothetical protein
MTLPARTNATSTWTNPAGQYADPTANTDCAIAFNVVASWDWPKLCSIVTHEYGHLLGHSHSPVRTDVMYPYYLAPIAGCRPRRKDHGGSVVRSSSARSILAA